MVKIIVFSLFINLNFIRIDVPHKFFLNEVTTISKTLLLLQ